LKNNDINLNPRPSALLESLRSIGYTLETALADIIDNSITANSNNISVRFAWNNGDPWIAIIDDGDGMSNDELIDAMRFGSRNPVEQRAKNDLGRFGLGMKTASISQCRHLVVASKKNNKIAACEWDLDRIAKSDSVEWLAGHLDSASIFQDERLHELVSDFLGSSKSGTILLWRRLDIICAAADENRFSDAMNLARVHLEMIFHRFISPDLGCSSIKIDFNNNLLEAFNPFGPAVPARQELTSETIHINGSEVFVQPYILPHRSKVPAALYEQYAGEQGYLHNQGFYIYRNRRLIISATWFRLIKKEELNKLIRVKVDITNDLDKIWKIDIKKSEASPPELVRKELKKIINKISGAGKLVFTRRATRLKNRTITPVWSREVADGKIRYGINQEHPLIKALLHKVTPDQAVEMKTCLRLITETFPHELFFADAASDTTEFVPPEHSEQEVRQAAVMLIDALRACGFAGDALRKQLLNTEAYPFPPELINELLP